MKTILAFFAVALFAGLAGAATYCVDIHGGAPFTEVQQAINIASAGDTIIVAAGLNYQGFTVDRQLVIMGAGTETFMSCGTQIAGVVIVTGAADGTELSGLWIRTNIAGTGSDSTWTILRISTGVTELLVKRCFIENSGSQGSANCGCAYVGNGSSVDFLQCSFYVPNQLIGATMCVVMRPGCQIEIASCVFSRCFTFIRGGDQTSSVAIRHTIFECAGGYGVVYNTPACVSIENSVALGLPLTIESCPNTFISYSATPTPVPPGVGNILSDVNQLLHFIAGNPRESDYHLSPSSNLHDAGNPAQYDLDSTRADIGIYGGLHPYVDGGVPDYPFVLDVDVPTSVPQSGAVRVYARGRIGPGY
jgi:hypothetical protein